MLWSTAQRCRRAAVGNPAIVAVRLIGRVPPRHICCTASLEDSRASFVVRRHLHVGAQVSARRSRRQAQRRATRAQPPPIPSSDDYPAMGAEDAVAREESAGTGHGSKPRRRRKAQEPLYTAMEPDEAQALVDSHVRGAWQCRWVAWALLELHSPLTLCPS